MAKRKPQNGRRSRQPVADAPPDKPAGRLVSVRSRREFFNRAGLRFTAADPVIVREDEVGTDRLEAILAEPNLRCEQL